MDEINLNDEHFKNKVDTQRAILISYNPNEFNVDMAIEYIEKIGGFGWGSSINLNLNKCPRYFYCYIHEKYTDMVRYVTIIDKLSSRSSKTEKIWKELKDFRKENIANKLVLFLRIIEKKEISIENFKKINGDKIHLAALRNFVWVKPL